MGLLYDRDPLPAYSNLTTVRLGPGTLYFDSVDQRQLLRRVRSPPAISNISGPPAATKVLTAPTEHIHNLPSNRIDSDSTPRPLTSPFCTLYGPLLLETVGLGRISRCGEDHSSFFNIWPSVICRNSYPACGPIKTHPTRAIPSVARTLYKYLRLPGRRPI